MFADFVVSIARCCWTHGIMCTIEQPASGWKFKLPEIERLLRRSGVSLNVLDYCQYEMAWKKRTAIVSIHLDLTGLCKICRGGHSHIRLRGLSETGVSWTQIAEPYPPLLCRLWAFYILREFDSTLGYPGEGPPKVTVYGALAQGQ